MTEILTREQVEMARATGYDSVDAVTVRKLRATALHHLQRAEDAEQLLAACRVQIAGGGKR